MEEFLQIERNSSLKKRKIHIGLQVGDNDNQMQRTLHNFLTKSPYFNVSVLYYLVSKTVSLQ